MPHRRRPTDAEIEQALRATRGMIAAAAQSVGISRTTLWRRMQANPELQAVAEEQTETVLDIAEGHLIRAVVEGDMEHVRYMLRTKGRKRGYGDREEIQRVDVTSAGKSIASDGERMAELMALVNEARARSST